MKKIITLVLVFLGCMSSIGSTTFAMDMSDDQLLSEEVSNFYPQRNQAVDAYLNSVNNGLYGNASSFSCPICFGAQSRATIAQHMQTEHSENPMETPSPATNSSHEFAPFSLELDDALTPTVKAGDTAQPTKKPTKKGQKKVYVSAIEKTKKSPSTSTMKSTQAYTRASKIEKEKDGYACDEPGCTQKRRTIYQIAQHIITHTGERAFECSVCKKNYTQPNTLNKHYCRGPVNESTFSNSNSSSNSMSEPMTDVADGDAISASSNSPLTPSTGCSVASNQVNDSTMSDELMQTQHAEKPMEIPSAASNSSYEFAPMALELNDALTPTVKAGDTVQPMRKPAKKAQKKEQEAVPEKAKKSPAVSPMESTDAYTRALKIEKGRRGYACDEPVCKTIQSLRYTLAQHIITHTGEKPFKCSVCKKDYTRSYSLNRHNCLGPVNPLSSSNSNSSSNSQSTMIQNEIVPMTDVPDADPISASSNSPLTPSTGCSVASNQVNDSMMSDVPMQIQHSPAPVQLVIPPVPQAVAPRALATPMSHAPVSSSSNDANQVVGKKRARDPLTPSTGYSEASEEVEENIQKPVAKKPRGLELLQLQKELYTAIDAGNSEGIRKILATGVSTNVSVRRAGKFQTPLELAIELGHVEIAKLLIQYDASQINKANSQGITPLMSAVGANAPLITHALLQAKATTQTKSNSGQTAMDYLITKVDKQHPNFGVLKFLLEQHAPSQKDENKKSDN